MQDKYFWILVLIFFFNMENFSDSFAATFLFPFVRIRIATVSGANSSLLSPLSYLVFKRQFLNIADSIFQ